MSGNGWCTHPDRQVSSDVRILVRKAELACRNAWGSDLWEDANAETPAARPVKIDPVELPMPSTTVSYDDEVTSVINADQHQASRQLDDEVVEQSTISFDDYGDDDQDERRELLYRDTGKSIERARERARQRHRQPVNPEDDVVISNSDTATGVTAQEKDQPVFEPDDFVEEEAPSSQSGFDEQDDALLSEGIRTLSPRARRLRRFREEHTLPKTENVTKVDPEPDDVEREVPRSAAPERGRFDSIPEVSAEIDLPLLRRASSAETPEEPAPRATTPEDSSYERALKRAHALNTAARAEQNVERRRAESPTAISTTPPPAETFATHAAMPDIPEVDEPVARQPLQPRRERPMSPIASLHQAVPEVPSSSTHEQPVQQSRPRPVRRERPTAEARRSWWRGSHQAVQEAAPEAREAIDFQPSADWDREPSRSFEPIRDDVLDRAEPEPDQTNEPNIVPVSFDLERAEDLESFRDRLFAAAPAHEVATTQRSPIAMTRREVRPISPAPRDRRPRELPVEPPEAIETRPERPERQQRSARPVRTESAPRERRQHIEPQELLQQPEDAWYEPETLPDFDVRNLVEPDTELLDMTIMISPDVQRACSTCRNYRPSEQPGRGWCTNTWAFTHRQMVNETDLACESTIGCWWLPADEEVWLSEFEVAADATPRVDRLIAHLDPERRAVGN